jgi:hypothetical protein
VVNSATAGKIVYAEKIAVLSANNKYETTAEKAVLLLYAELMPVATTYQQVKWEIISGSDLATIDQNGLLTARTPNNGGVVTVKATTADGTNLSTTRNITIGAIVVEENPEPNPEDKVCYTVTFQDWDGTILKTEQVEQGQSATAPTNPTREGYTFIGWDTDFTNVQSDLLVKALYEANDPINPDYDPITVRLNPTSAPTWREVYLYAWTDQDGQFCGNWPGVKVSQADGWWSYTFDPSIQITNIIWNAGAGKEQTVDILNVTESTCYELVYNATNISVVEVDCSLSTAIDNIEEESTLRPRKEMIDGILYIIMPDGTKYTMQGKRVK